VFFAALSPRRRYLCAAFLPATVFFVVAAPAIAHAQHPQTFLHNAADPMKAAPPNPLITNASDGTTSSGRDIQALIAALDPTLFALLSPCLNLIVFRPRRCGSAT
jgi:hypothetical protein